MQRYVCPFDETAMREVEIPFTVTVKGVQLSVRGIMQCVCQRCGAELVPMEMVRENTQRVADAKRAHMGLLSGSEIARIRSKVLGLSRHSASLRFGLGRNAFYKYEEEGQLQSQPTDKLLRALNHSPAALVALRTSDRPSLSVDVFESKTTEVVEASTEIDTEANHTSAKIYYLNKRVSGAR